MRHTLALLISLALAGSVATAVEATQDPKPPLKLVFPSKAGDVLFDHAAHLAREKGRCGSCHEKPWPRAGKEPLGSSAGCKTCHQAAGKSFEMKDHCKKCHLAAADAGAGSK
jgi:formate-dependent nitrite reductase cytochrome c552 subunit